MPTDHSAYFKIADKLRDNGYHPMPAIPGKKVPGTLIGDKWEGLPRWQQWCDKQPPEFLHSKWQDWPDAGVCIAHGAVVGLDVDTDRKDVSDAAIEAVGPSPVRRRGSKGWMGYYRPGAAAEGHSARLRWYDLNDSWLNADGRRQYRVCVELLLHGTQSVLPPTIHPDTAKPYIWLTNDTLEDTPTGDLPELQPDAVERLDKKLGAIGLTRKVPGARPDMKSYGRAEPTAHDLEKPWGRMVNDKALLAIDSWWPALDMPKSRQRGPGAWEAVPWWRSSNSGRDIGSRNPNLRAISTGIVDFGADRSYTPIDLVVAARDCSVKAAGEWLQQFIPPEDRIEIDLDELANNLESRSEKVNGFHSDLSRWTAVPVFSEIGSRSIIKPAVVPSDAEFEALVPKEQPFPITSFDSIPGLLGEVASYLDSASATTTEAGAIAVALPMLGAVMGRGYETPSKLRTNIYTVALGGSGKGKTSLVNPAKELLQLAQLPNIIGQDSIASGSGLLRMMTVHPCRVVFLDEFGHMLQQICSPGSGVHARQIITEFTKLYSSASSLYTGTAYATREPQPIDCPHLCLFGMATPEQFWRAFGSSSLEDGSIARYLVFPIGNTESKDPDTASQEFIAKGIKAVTAAMRGNLKGDLQAQQAVIAPLEPAADEARIKLRETMVACAEYAELNGVRGGSAILLRVVENALKIALVSAVGRNSTEPVISAQDFEIGHALARWSASTMIWNIASHIADNQTERDVNDVERKVKAAGSAGILKGILKDRCRNIRGRDFQEIIDRLEEAGRIVVKPVVKTKPGVRIIHVDNQA